MSETESSNPENALYAGSSQNFENVSVFNNRINFISTLQKADIFSFSQVENREFECELLLSLSSQLLLVQNKKQLSDIIHKHFEQFLTFSNFEITSVNTAKNTRSCYLSHYREDDVFSPDFLSLTGLSFSLDDAFFKQFLYAKEPSIACIEKLAEPDQIPVYISIWKKAGIREILAIPILQGSRTCDVLFLMSKDESAFNTAYFELFMAVAGQIAKALLNLRALQELKEKEFESEVLLSLSNEIATIRNKKALLNVLHQKLRLLFPFNDLLITCPGKDKDFHYCFLHKYEKKRTEDPFFEKLITAQYAVKGSIIEAVMEVEDPVVFLKTDLAAMENQKQCYDFFQRNGLCELTGVALRNGKREIGAFFLTSEKSDTYSHHQLDLLRGVSSLISIAVNNILANDTIFEREREKSILLKLGNSIASIRQQNQLLIFLQDKVKKLVHFDGVLIMTCDENRKNQLPFIANFGERKAAQTGFQSSKYDLVLPVHEVVNQIIKSDGPVLFDVPKLFDYDYVPVCIAYCHNLGIKEFLGVPLKSGERIIGILFLFSDQAGIYQKKDFDLIQGIADQLSLSVINIKTNEDLLIRENEKSTLLAISNDLAGKRKKEDLLKILHERLKKIFDFSHTVIALANPAHQTYAGYIFDPYSQSRAHPGYAKLHTADYPLDDFLMKMVVGNESPVVFDIDHLILNPQVPQYILMQYESGMREIVYNCLYNGNKLLGFLMILSERKGAFTAKNLLLIQGICYQLSNAVANFVAQEEILQREEEKSMLLSIGNDIATIRNKLDLQMIINDKLKKLLPISHILTCTVSQDGKHYKPYILDPQSKSKNHKDYIRIINDKCLVNDSISDSVLSADYPVVFNLSELIKRPDVPAYLQMNYECGIKEVVFSALTNGKQKIGILVIFLEFENRLNAGNLSLIQGVSAQLSTAIANIVANEEIIQSEKEKSLLLEFSNNIAAVRDKSGLSKVISEGLKSFFDMKEYILSLKNEDELTHSYYLYDVSAAFADNPGFQKIKNNKFTIAGGLAEMVFNSSEPVNFNVTEILDRSDLNYPTGQFWQSMGVTDVLGIPLRVGSKNIGILWTFPNRINERLLQGVSSQIAIALANTVANERIEKQVIEISHFRQQLLVENLYLQEEIQTTHNYSEIIGTSAAMEKVFQMVSQVCETQSSVLLLGETGTGKELIARAVHNTSPRRDKLMVKVNCATLPANLIESELFGHEKGSFTGATERRIGKFELANRGTLFLDEIGEMPLDLQVKLLRALQEKEIERVGGRTVIKTDVRVIAATNRDLQKEVQLGNFRSDLFFRLNVFPITIPPLRERREDIPILASHFLEKHAKKGGKKVLGFTADVVQELLEYNWPGNVRELEHLIERSILLTSQPLINQVHLPGKEVEKTACLIPGARVKTIDEVEREHIMLVLKACNWQVAGVGGAAELLLIPPTTLNSKIKRLKIKKEYNMK